LSSKIAEKSANFLSAEMIFDGSEFFNCPHTSAIPDVLLHKNLLTQNRRKPNDLNKGE
jgi:hypothetical protein